SVCSSCSSPLFLSLLRRPPPRPPLFPYTTLFRSVFGGQVRAARERVRRGVGCLVGRAVRGGPRVLCVGRDGQVQVVAVLGVDEVDRKSTRLNSSHVKISYAVFCLKKKKKRITVSV